MASGLEFGGGDRLKPDPVAGLDREVAGFDVGDAEWRRTRAGASRRAIAPG